MVRANFLARASAACLLACPLLILPPLPDVSRPSRVSILTTVVYCHLPPRAVGILLRFNSSASARREMKPAALSSRRVETKARARESAARLLANAPCIPRLRDEVPPLTCSIGPFWQDLDVRLGVKNMSRSGLRAENGPSGDIGSARRGGGPPLPVACFVETARNARLDTPRRCSHAGKACPAA
jgi:hypothetical protein